VTDSLFEWYHSNHLKGDGLDEYSAHSHSEYSPHKLNNCHNLSRTTSFNLDNSKGQNLTQQGKKDQINRINNCELINVKSDILLTLCWLVCLSVCLSVCLNWMAFWSYLDGTLLFSLPQSLSCFLRCVLMSLSTVNSWLKLRMTLGLSNYPGLLWLMKMLLPYRCGLSIG